ncbi:MAG: peptidylprolyl isomerase [Thermoguttaceae bacterium]
MAAQQLTTVLGCLAGFVLAMGPVAAVPAENGTQPVLATPGNQPVAGMPAENGFPPAAPGGPMPAIGGLSPAYPSGGPGAMPGQYAPPTFFSPPNFPVRSDMWPGGGSGSAGMIGPLPRLGPYQPGPLKPVETAQTLARVPNDVVQTGDLFAVLDELVAKNLGKAPAAELEKQRVEAVRELTAGIRQLVEHLNDPDPGSYVDSARLALIQQLLHQQVERKLIYQDFLRTVPPEALPNVEQMVNRQFDQTELPKLLRREDAESRQDLEWKLRARGSSLDREKRIFMERAVADEWVQEQIKGEKTQEVTHEQMLNWYQAHLKEFEKPARARWEELAVSLAKHRSSEEAYAAVAAMGNQVLAGAPLADVARARSDGPTADQGGLRDWTSQGSLVCEDLDRTLFALPPGQLSKIIQSNTGYHIIRVVERQAARRIPFLEAQKEVREKIQQEWIHDRVHDYLERIKKQFPVWTIFDAAASKPARGAAVETPRY